jgi:polyisoprenoid-binding protein YceI
VLRLSLILPLLATLASVLSRFEGATPQSLPRRFELDSMRTRIGFEADATMGAFRGNARKVTGWVETSAADFADARGEIDVEAALLQTGIGMRDRHLRETLETNAHPRIHFKLDSARFARRDSAGAWHRLYGVLTVRNVSRRPEILARISTRGDTIGVLGRISTRFTEFEMKPPSRVLGTVKVKDAFTITFDCTFVARTASTEAERTPGIPSRNPPGQ